MANETRALTEDDERSIAEAQARLDARLEEVEKAKAEGRLAELVRDTPPVREQLRRFLDSPA